ncbi:E3 binding domain-containing protein, partial [Streptomyces olivochromogenes]|uniref:E3 binding domain-containing protein n=1 Tax=Streptomyces olivochromogenes TaxID=1963 RepID=UPI001911877E
YDGVVRELHFPEGTTVDVGQVIIAVDVTGGPAPTGQAPVAVETPVEETPAEEPEPEGRKPVLVGYGVATSATKRRPRKYSEFPPHEVSPAIQEELSGHGGNVVRRPLAKPPVRKLAKDLGVDLATITPSGPDGIITREDVHAAAAPAPAP